MGKIKTVFLEENRMTKARLKLKCEALLFLSEVTTPCLAEVTTGFLNLNHVLLLAGATAGHQ